MKLKVVQQFNLICNLYNTPIFNERYVHVICVIDMQRSQPAERMQANDVSQNRPTSDLMRSQTSLQRASTLRNRLAFIGFLIV